MEKSDNQHYEVKTAAGGFPASAVDSICAFSNTPGGGMLLFGVDENLGFAVVGVYDSKACQQTLANYAKKEFSVPVDLTSGLVAVNDKKVVWAEIGEVDKTLKPVKTRKGKKAFIRQYDGDFVLSEQEEQMFISARGQSRFDEDTVPGTGGEELNWELTEAFIKNRKSRSTTLAKMDDHEVLLRCGVLGRSGELTKAGLLCLGIYPQQYLPNYTIKASVQKQSRQTGKVRATSTHSFDGPIPTMLYEAVQWVLDNSEDLVLDLPGGSVRNISEYPPIVMRELIANSLIHRDLSPLSMIQEISLRIEDDRLIISNPGGLYGLHVDELGHTGSKTRNSRVADICQYVLAPDSSNVIERLGSGIPKVMDELAALDMPAPRFIDGGIYFTVILSSVLTATSATNNAKPKNSNTDLVLAALSKGSKSKTEIQRATHLSYGKTKYAVEKLLKEQKVYKIGKDKSPNTVYALILDD
ncbi:MAG: putative DNA binding domain-containing protein [Coriobacteriales bacterium]|nr:putative DNA binding domain-containing protein [Coriobacteriales bacterium]